MGEEKSTTKTIIQTEPKKGKFMTALRKMEVATNVNYLGGASVLKLDYKDKQFCALLFLPRDDDNGNNHHNKYYYDYDDKENKETSVLLPLPLPLPSQAMKQKEEKSVSLSSQAMKDIVDGLKNQRTFDRIISDLTVDRVDLSLPRFKVEYGTVSLTSKLQRLGMSAAFGDGTDKKKLFTPMSDDPDIHIDDVFHKAVMEVTEEGTVAAAATAVPSICSVPPPPIRMKF